MSIKGFSVGGVVQRYDYTALDNLPQGQGVSDDLKAALLQLAQKVAYIDDQGQTYYDDLYDALYPEKTLLSITANFQQGQAVVYNTDSLDSLKQYLTVTAIYDDASTETVPSSAYTLSGTLTTGTSVITVTYEGKTDAFNVTVTAAPMSFPVTNNLSGCTTSNSASNIAEGSAYNAVITASSGYTLVGATVSITMGGQDITTSAYSGGIISINNVDGALVIAVSAVERVLSSISAVYTPEQDTPVTIDPTRISAYIATDGRWIASSDSYSVCVPVTRGKRYKFQFTSTSSTDVGAVFRFGFSDSSAPTEQTLTGWLRSTPQDYVATEITASGSYLVIQLSSSVASSVISNGFLSLTELGTVIYDTDTLDSLKANLVVTAVYSDSSTQNVPDTDYTLSGTLADGTSTITVSYSGKTATFSVTVVKYWDISWDYTMGTPIGNGWKTGTSLPGVMESDGFKLSSTSSAGGELSHDPNIENVKGTFEVELTFSRIGSVYQGFCIFSPGMRLRIYSGKLWFNGSSTNTQQSQSEIANLSANTKYTIRWEYVKANYARVYVDGTLVHTQSSALADSTTRLFINNTPSSSAVATIHAIRFREVS